MFKIFLISMFSLKLLFSSNLGIPDTSNSSNYKVNQLIKNSGYYNYYNYKFKYPNFNFIVTNINKVNKMIRKSYPFSTDLNINKKYRNDIESLKGTNFLWYPLSNISTLDFSKQSLLEVKKNSNLVPINKDLVIAWDMLGIFINSIIISQPKEFSEDNYVIINGVYHSKIKYINKVLIPTHFYTIFYNIRTQKYLAWLIPNIKMNHLEIVKYKTTIKKIETLTGINFNLKY